MRIVFKTNIYKGAEGFVTMPGEAVDITDAEAQGYIAAGMAEAAPPEEEPAAAPEAAAKSK